MTGETVISADQVQTYRDKGYVVVEDLFSAEDVQEMKTALDTLIEGARGLSDHTNVIDLEPSHRSDAPRVRRIKEPFLYDDVFNRMARHPRLLSVLTALLGPTCRMHGSKINLKSAEYGSPVEWHQDWAFYPHTNDDVLAVGVMLDDMTEDNGPMLCVPGSHKGPTYDHHQDGRFVGAMDPDDCPDLDKAEMILGRAGACSFHHVRAVHGSGQNTSGRDRRLLLYQVAAGDAWDLRGFHKAGTWDGYAKTFIQGEPTNQPRLVEAPVRLPYPEPLKGGSIYESQSVARKKYFGTQAAE
ncbi:MAG: phytanoyl-CoA dioxygenase [Rhodospirillaceae bacterium]|nr:phytanoyl-CoA dioxygenase [Rhodospirillaceae bacterium]